MCTWPIWIQGTEIHSSHSKGGETVECYVGIQNRKLRKEGKGQAFMPDLASVLCSLPSFGCLFGYYLHGILQPPIFSPTSPSNSAPFCFDSHSASKLSFPRSGMLARGILSLKPQGYKLVNHFGIGHPGVRSPPCPNQLRPRGPCFRIRPYLASRSCPRLFHRRGT